ncbi:MAG: RidA family protein [Planctomycetes bacterium]|nr:RidA family protein [Planctomycetota bacterium]
MRHAVPRRSSVVAALVAAALAGCSSQPTISVTTTLPADAPTRFHPSPDEARRALPFSESVEAGGFLFLAGAIGTAPGTFELVPGGIEAETRATMENLRLALERRGCTFADVVKATVFLVDMAEWPKFNEIYATYFDGRYPARSALGAAALARGARVEVEFIAKLPPPR